MAIVNMPLGSFDAKGQVAKGIIFSKWRGINYVKRYFVPANPRTVTQVNLRTAFSLAVSCYQALSQGQKDAYDVGAKGQQYSGYNLAIRRMVDEYIVQLGTAVLPVSVTNVGDYPAEVITWT